MNVKLEILIRELENLKTSVKYKIGNNVHPSIKELMIVP